MNKEAGKEGAVIKQALVLIVLIIGVSLSGSMCLLWGKQEIERLAEDNRQIERKLVTEERRLRYLDTKIAEIHQPAYLEQQNKLLALGLVAPNTNQVVYLENNFAEPGMLYALEEVETDKEEKDPFRRSFDLAVMESLKALD